MVKSNNNKVLCTTHNFYYKGNVCPFCENDRINAYVRRYKKPADNNAVVENKKVNKADEPVTEDMLQNLVNHFNK